MAQLQHYNPMLECLKLHTRTFDEVHQPSQQDRLDDAKKLNAKYNDLTTLSELLSRAQPGKKLDLTEQAALIDRIRDLEPSILIDQSYTWSSEKEIQKQLDNLRARISIIPSEINLKYSDLGQGEKDMAEISKVISDMQREKNEEAKHMVARQTS